MAVATTGPRRPEDMTTRQLDRRRRVLDAAHELLAGGSPHEVQVKDIAERAGVSLAAIYHYFSSKDHLLGEALVDWAGGLTAGRRRRSLPEDPAERFTELVRRGVRAYRRAPQYAALFLSVAASRDPHAIECMGRLNEGVGGAMADALAYLEPGTALDVQRIVGNAWTGGLFECVHGLSTYAELERSMVEACRLLLAAARPDARVS
jgi:TetR/AcrR family transcriptional regulator, cholesterol catabolism regulator